MTRGAVTLMLPLLICACAVNPLSIKSLDSGEINSPNTLPEDKKSEADGDLDGDGVFNASDQCSDTSPAHTVDATGCDLFSGKISGVEFAPNEYVLDARARNALDDLVVKLNAHPDVVLAIGGHTDNRGNARDNLELSKRRVLAVVRYLVFNGVSGRRLHPHGYGESRPLRSNATEEGRSHNRRIEISQIMPESKL